MPAFPDLAASLANKRRGCITTRTEITRMNLELFRFLLTPTSHHWTMRVLVPMPGHSPVRLFPALASE
jgi:hypothetical protein